MAMFTTHVLREWAWLPVTTFTNYCCMDAACKGFLIVKKHSDGTVWHFFLLGALGKKKKNTTPPQRAGDITPTPVMSAKYHTHTTAM